jgi:gas vesicle protein
MSKDGNNSKEFLIGTLIGGLIGAVTALLLAPKSGKELRSDLNELAASWKERTNQLTNQAFEKSFVVAEAAKEKTISLSQAVSKQSSQLLNKVKDFKQDSQATDAEMLEEVNENNDNYVRNDSEDIQKKLIEAKKALDEVESNLQQVRQES